MAPYHLLLPIKLDAVFNTKVYSGGPNQAKITPITQPNYTFLQFKDHLVQNDILSHVNLHNLSLSLYNPCFTDIGKASTLDDLTVPNYPAIPNRWLVICSNPNADITVPKGPPGLNSVTSWVFKSDRTSNIDALPESMDLEVDTAPFMTAFVKQGIARDILVEQQTEVVIGSYIEALFINYQYHYGNVFSMLDTFAYQGADSSVQHLKSAMANYYVIGWHSSPDKEATSAGDGAKSRARIRPPFDDKLDQPGAAHTLCHGAMYNASWSSKELPKHRAANTLAETMPKMPLPKMPFAVGTTPIDGVLAYLSKQSPTKDLESGLLALQTLLRADKEGVDAQMATDKVQATNYAHFDSSNHYFLPAKGGKHTGADPSQSQQDALRLNNRLGHGHLSPLKPDSGECRFKVFQQDDCDIKEVPD
ncbi:hypothetical protein B0T25DRAFT_618042 [Lasiosphaeria hispida]|uniref:Uncharacterized protein n=1 Tax=Lasiosphaeria hispida TaxID=260671 RepID=A0AAJ0H4S8_9PEZI|nr:hypothetical protein B0T25DRAFT_618042 [Lasiosphaeria hispida]